jgi:hypothetical protein
MINQRWGKGAAQHVSNVPHRSSLSRGATMLQVSQFAQGRARHLHPLA